MSASRPFLSDQGRIINLNSIQGPQATLLTNLHSAEGHLIDMIIEHADLDPVIDQMALAQPLDELLLLRLKKRRLALRDKIARVKYFLRPSEPA
jgi:hypothetical protein